MPVKNVINFSSEVSRDNAFRVYRPGVEVEITNAIINRFIFDGNLKISSPSDADAIVDAKLVDYRRDPLRYNDDDDVQEYRLNVVVDCAVYQRDRKVLWRETLAGDSTFFLAGPRATSEDEAVAQAVDDLARRVVERTFEVW